MAECAARGARALQRRALACGLGAVLFAARSLNAEPLPSAAPGPPSAAAPGPSAEPEPNRAEPGQTSIADPDLAPPPQPAKRLATWQQALGWLKASSPVYLSTYRNIERAEAALDAARSHVLPSLGGQGTYTHQFFTDRVSFGAAAVTVPPPNVWTASVSLSWPLLDLAAFHALGTAARGVDVSRLGFSETRRELANDVVDRMLTTLAAERVAELNRAGLEAALQRRRLTQIKLEYKQGTPLDVERTEQDVAAARADLISGDESLRQSREALGVALGSAQSVAAPSDLDLNGFVAAVARTCSTDQDIEQRPDVARARAQVEIAQRRLSEASLAFAPTLSVNSTLAYDSQVTFGPNTTWNVQGILSVPIFEGGARFATRREARAVFEQAEQALLLARLNALVEAAQADRAVRVLGRSRDVAARQRDLARSIDQRTREGYAHGLGTSLDLVVSAQALRSAETALVLLQFQVAEAKAHAYLSKARCWY